MCYYVVVDLEMCRVPKAQRKLYRYKNEIIQIGAALMDSNLNVIDTFSEYVKPEYGFLDSFISKLMPEYGKKDIDKIWRMQET